MKLGKHNQKLCQLLLDNGSEVVTETGTRLKLTPTGYHNLKPNMKKSEKDFIYLGQRSFRIGETVVKSINMERWRDKIVKALTEKYRERSADKNPGRIFS